MPLTTRALAWLATLPRGGAMPTSQVDQLIRDAGGTPHPTWLDFHDRYAGYVETVGPGDVAVWGLAIAADATPRPQWNQPNRVHLIPGYDDFPEAIVCADANPVHQYELSADGWFAGLGGPCPSFDMKIERHGVMHELHSRGAVQQTLHTRQSDAPQYQQLLTDMAQWLIPEASNKEAQFYLAPTGLLQYNPLIKQLVLYELVS